MRDGGVSEKVRLTKSPLKPMMPLEVTHTRGWVEGGGVRGWMSKFKSGYESVENYCAREKLRLLNGRSVPRQGLKEGVTLEAYNCFL